MNLPPQHVARFDAWDDQPVALSVDHGALLLRSGVLIDTTTGYSFDPDAPAARAAAAAFVDDLTPNSDPHHRDRLRALTACASVDEAAWTVLATASTEAAYTLAGNTAAPGHLRQQAVESIFREHTADRCRLMENMARSDDAQLLVWVAACAWGSVAKLVASNKRADERALRLTATHKSVEVRTTTAGHANTPADLLTTMARDRSPKVRYAVAANHATPAEALDRLADSAVRAIWRAVRDNPSASPDTLRKLAARIMRSPRFTPDATALAGNPDAHALASNPSMPADVLDQLVEGPSNLRQRVAEHPNTSSDTLTTLAGDVDPVVRARAVGHPSITDAGRAVAALASVS